MISKDLLSEVLGEDKKYSHIKVTEDFIQYVDDECYNPIRIDIYRFAHKSLVHFSQHCIGYEFVFTPYRLCIVKNNEVIYDVMYEPKYNVHVIFKACQWILDNKGDT